MDKHRQEEIDSDSYVEKLIQEGRFPRFSTEEQLLFLAYSDQGKVLKRIGVRKLNKKFRDHIIKITRDEAVQLFAKPEYREILEHQDSHDGIYISMEKEHQLVSQERGHAMPYLSFASEREMLEYLVDRMLSENSEYYIDMYPDRKY